MSFSGGVEDGLPGLRVVVEFGGVAGLEFGPFLVGDFAGFAEFVAGGNVFEPGFHVEIFLLDAAGPEAVDEESGPVVFGCGVVDAFDLNLGFLGHRGFAFDFGDFWIGFISRSTCDFEFYTIGEEISGGRVIRIK